MNAKPETVEMFGIEWNKKVSNLTQELSLNFRIYILDNQEHGSFHITHDALGMYANYLKNSMTNENNQAAIDRISATNNKLLLYINTQKFLKTDANSIGDYYHAILTPYIKDDIETICGVNSKDLDEKEVVVKPPSPQKIRILLKEKCMNKHINIIVLVLILAIIGFFITTNPLFNVLTAPFFGSFDKDLANTYGVLLSGILGTICSLISVILLFLTLNDNRLVMKQSNHITTFSFFLKFKIYLGRRETKQIYTKLRNMQTILSDEWYIIEDYMDIFVIINMSIDADILKKDDCKMLFRKYLNIIIQNKQVVFEKLIKEYDSYKSFYSVLEQLDDHRWSTLYKRLENDTQFKENRNDINSNRDDIEGMFEPETYLLIKELLKEYWNKWGIEKYQV